MAPTKVKIWELLIHVLNISVTGRAAFPQIPRSAQCTAGSIDCSLKAEVSLWTEVALALVPRVHFLPRRRVEEDPSGIYLYFSLCGKPVC